MRLGFGGVLLGLATSIIGCTGSASATAVESTVLRGAPEVVGDVGDSAPAPQMTIAANDPVDAGLQAVGPGATVTGLTGDLALGSTLRTTTTLNLRTGPGTENSVRLVLPDGANVLTVNVSSPENGWYNVSYNGVEGWASGKYLELVRGPVTDPTVRDLAIARAQGGVGFSYWWGHGRWIPSGATSSSIGSCTGNCPSCTHSGSYGADCSGYVGKIWEVPSSNTDPQSDSHPYSTISFNGSNAQWSTIDRAALKSADALVYNVNGSGHIFIYESGDGWGSIWAYEARGCAYGIVHNLRTAGTAFKAITRTGYSN